MQHGPGPVLVRPEDPVAELRHDVGDGAPGSGSPSRAGSSGAPSPMLTVAPQRNTAAAHVKPVDWLTDWVYPGAIRTLVESVRDASRAN